MKINKYGMTMNGLKHAAGETNFKGEGYVQISYDKGTGDILTSFHNDCNWCTCYHDPDVIHVASANYHMTMQEIADAVFSAVEDEKAFAEMVEAAFSADDDI